MRDLQKEKRDHPHSPPSKVEGVKIVVISFRNIAKKKRKNQNAKGLENEAKIGNVQSVLSFVNLRPLPLLVHN